LKVMEAYFNGGKPLVIDKDKNKAQEITKPVRKRTRVRR
jgi:hypothetical protein